MELQHSIEERVGFLIVSTVLIIGVGLLIETVPLFFTKVVTRPVPDAKPYNTLQVAGRNIYVHESCYSCHSQVIRPFRVETEYYGHYSVAGESVYNRLFQRGSRRTGPDLARVGGRYSDEWHRIHLLNPCDVAPESNIPAFLWLVCNKADTEATVRHMKALRSVGTPYGDEEIERAPEALENKSELSTATAYLQGLGLASRNVK